MVEYNVDWLIVIYYETMGEKKRDLGWICEVWSGGWRWSMAKISQNPSVIWSDPCAFHCRRSKHCPWHLGFCATMRNQGREKHLPPLLPTRLRFTFFKAVMCSRCGRSCGLFGPYGRSPKGRALQLCAVCSRVNEPKLCVGMFSIKTLCIP